MFITYIEDVINACETQQMSPDATSKQLNYLIALCFHKRDIQDGAGERDCSYWMFIHLFEKFPEIMSELLEIFVSHYGSILDLNKLSCIIAKDLENKNLN